MSWSQAMTTANTATATNASTTSLNLVRRSDVSGRRSGVHAPRLRPGSPNRSTSANASVTQKHTCRPAVRAVTIAPAIRSPTSSPRSSGPIVPAKAATGMTVHSSSTSRRFQSE